VHTRHARTYTRVHAPAVAKAGSQSCPDHTGRVCCSGACAQRPWPPHAQGGSIRVLWPSNWSTAWSEGVAVLRTLVLELQLRRQASASHGRPAWLPRRVHASQRLHQASASHGRPTWLLRRVHASQRLHQASASHGGPAWLLRRVHASQHLLQASALLCMRHGVLARSLRCAPASRLFQLASA
jgi:hypothetical protein